MYIRDKITAIHTLPEKEYNYEIFYTDMVKNVHWVVKILAQESIFYKYFILITLNGKIL